MTKKIRTYSAELKAEAIKKIVDNNGNISDTAVCVWVTNKTPVPSHLPSACVRSSEFSYLSC